MYRTSRVFSRTGCDFQCAFVVVISISVISPYKVIMETSIAKNRLSFKFGMTVSISVRCVRTVVSCNEECLPGRDGLQ